jgi:hypothetical protein
VPYVGACARLLVPPAGFEPAISTLKGWRPRPLDDGGGPRGVYLGTLRRSGSISRILSRAIISLGRAVARRLLAPNLELGEQPVSPARTRSRGDSVRSGSGLLRVEFGPFHPQRLPPSCPSRRPGIVSVPLVLASRRTGVTRYPALWSADFPRSPTTFAGEVARLPDPLRL